MTRLALFASGNGTNVQQIAEYFIGNPNVKVEIVILNKKNAFAGERAARLGIDSVYFNRNDFYQSDNVLNCLIERRIDYIILAGFLWLVPDNLLTHFESKILNIHPALLPAYGGKGMYGHYVHEAVVANGERISGISIHLVNKEYDKGRILFQATCPLSAEDTPDDLAAKVHLLEKAYFPSLIAAWLR
ncbi:MAG: phosphoribosylglycinamide formyltransferase [Bacteroidales bacterium]|jgi:phosphoribosylglycinamide formyltransferase-1|nr:phosphoribosylglycinamide formyltransferase [Bacteroidales bacterium]